MINQLPAPVQAATKAFPIVIGYKETNYTTQLGAAWAPGRVNLIGEHTDYNDGFVLPIAVERVATFAGRGRNDGMIGLWSLHFEEYAEFTLEGLPATFEQQHSRLPGWAQYILAVVTELLKAGAALAGFDAVVGGDVPLGGGMSSSAALEVATVQACALFSQGRLSIGTEEATLEPMQVAAICQRAEHIASGLRSGILDQAASCLGQPGKAILLDCRSYEHHYLPFESPELALVVIDTGVRRELAASAYNERRKQCEEATTLLKEVILAHEPENEAAHQISALRDVSQEQFERYRGELPELLQRRAGYVIAENARVLKTVELLQAHDFTEIGQMLWRSHVGLRDDYEVSCFELDTLIEIAQQIRGVLGARMLGGGFGGCTINLVQNTATEALRQAIEQLYPPRTGRQARIDTCHAAGGPGSSWVR